MNGWYNNISVGLWTSEINPLNAEWTLPCIVWVQLKSSVGLKGSTCTYCQFVFYKYFKNILKEGVNWLGLSCAKLKCGFKRNI